MRRYCAETIFKCAENDPVTRDLVRQCGGLDPLVAMAKDPKTKENKPLLAAVTGAIWKTAITEENVRRYDQLRTIEVKISQARTHHTQFVIFQGVGETLGG